MPAENTANHHTPTQAYLSGNKALAKQLAAEGRAHGARMFAAHGRAAEETFAMRNREAAERAAAAGPGRPAIIVRALCLGDRCVLALRK